MSALRDYHDHVAARDRDLTPDWYAQAAEEFAAATEGVVMAKMFGSEGLKVGTKFFASLSKGRFVIKLPRGRVDELVETGDGERFDPGSGRAMKEWVVLIPSDRKQCLTFLNEAHTFVSTTSA